MSAEQKSLAYSSDLDTRWNDLLSQYPNSSRPDVDLVRYVTPGEMPDAMADCLAAAGFEAEVTTDTEGPGFTATSPAGQEESLAVSWFVCEAEYPVDPEFTQPLTKDEIAFMYDYNVHTLLPCLRDLGFDLAEPPSQQRYEERFGTAEGWFPYLEVYPLGQNATETASKACPQNPPGFRE